MITKPMNIKAIIIFPCLLLCLIMSGCNDRSKGLSPGQYSVSIETIEDHGSLLVQRITLTTTSNRQVVLAEPGGTESSSTSPSMDKPKTAEFEIILTANTIQPSSTINERQAIVSMVITNIQKIDGKTTRTSTRYAQMSLPIEKSHILTDVVTQRDTAGVFKDKQFLLRLKSGQRHIDLYIE
jgi:hypothetical protein